MTRATLPNCRERDATPRVRRHADERVRLDELGDALPGGDGFVVDDRDADVLDPDVARRGTQLLLDLHPPLAVPDGHELDRDTERGREQPRGHQRAQGEERAVERDDDPL